MSADRRLDVDALVGAMTVEEKASLTAGADLWTTVGVPRLGIPAVRLTDGPHGARGSRLGTWGPPSVCVPCGAALGASWDPHLVERIGALLGEEARRKGARVLLAPTVNLHRSPLAGRTFECYSEDPLLSGRLAAGFVRGVQSRGVAATVKHFVANEAEFERHTISSEVDERTLRELYLVPFELAVREGGALAVMTSYNRLNGRYTTQRPDLLRDILRGEWGFEGLVMTDWWAVASTVESAAAGLDLEMPGPGRAYGPALATAVRDGRVPDAHLDGCVHRLLSVFDRLGALSDPQRPPAERSVDDARERALAREAAAASTVLLANDGILPLDASRTTSLVVIGPNAARSVMMGGGSAAVRPPYRTSLLAAVRHALEPDATVTYEPGCAIDWQVPTLTAGVLRTSRGDPGLEVDYYATPDWTGPAVHRGTASDTAFLSTGSPVDGVPGEDFSLRAAGWYEPGFTGSHTFTLVQAGRARLVVDGRVVIDGVADPPGPGQAFLGRGSVEVAGDVDLVAGRPVDIAVEYSTDGSRRVHGFRVGCRQPWPDDLLERAGAAAAAADVAVLVVGTDDEWETEGRDRRTMSLPGRQDELVERVASANPNCVVVVNAGSPVALPWADRVRAVVWSWFGGQEMATALADVLLGARDPGGRLPVTIPRRLHDNPSYGTFPGEHGRVRYGEGLLVGYRWYEARDIPVTFPFGHGLSYTTFELGAPTVSATSVRPGDPLTVEVPVTNTGARPGSEVVQAYVAPPPGPAFRPPKELKAFAKLTLAAGETGVAVLRLDERAFARWDPGPPPWAVRDGERPPGPAPGWRVDPGRYDICIGRSSTDIRHVVSVRLEPTSGAGH